MSEIAQCMVYFGNVLGGTYTSDPFSIGGEHSALRIRPAGGCEDMLA